MNTYYAFPTIKSYLKKCKNFYNIIKVSIIYNTLIFNKILI